MLDSVFYWLGVATALTGGTGIVGSLAIWAIHLAWKLYKNVHTFGVVMQAVREYHENHPTKRDTHETN